MRRVVLTGAVVVLWMRLGAGCSSDASSPAAPPATADAGSADVAKETATYPDPDPVPPPDLPHGWELERAYSKSCGFYVPKAPEYLPEPVKWAACPSTVIPASASCSLMEVGWKAIDPQMPAGVESAWVAPNGVVYLAIYREVVSQRAYLPWRYTIITPADGVPISALLQTDFGLCSAGSTEIGDGRYVTQIFEHNSAEGGGLRAGEVSAFRPGLHLHLQPAVAHSPHAGGFGIVDHLGKFELLRWEDGAPLGTLWSPAQDDYLQQGRPSFVAGAMFWPASTYQFHKVHVYTPAGGVRDLLSAGLTISHGIADLGTDGEDMIWIDAQGRTDATKRYDTYTVQTAPFTTDPALVSARRVRSELAPRFGANPFVVGCGFAARSNGSAVRVIRLSDGQSWLLPQDYSAGFAWDIPYALTCSELFVRVATGGQFRVARVRLDSLGPGVPPD